MFVLVNSSCVILKKKKKRKEKMWAVCICLLATTHSGGLGDVGVVFAWHGSPGITKMAGEGSHTLKLRDGKSIFGTFDCKLVGFILQLSLHYLG